MEIQATVDFLSEKKSHFCVPYADYNLLSFSYYFPLREIFNIQLATLLKIALLLQEEEK